MPFDTVFDPFTSPALDPAALGARMEEAKRQQAEYLLHLIREAGRRLAEWLHLPPPSALRHS